MLLAISMIKSSSESPPGCGCECVNSNSYIYLLYILRILDYDPLTIRRTAQIVLTERGKCRLFLILLLEAKFSWTTVTLYFTVISKLVQIN